MKHQIESAQFLASTHRGYCFDDAGTGKTTSTLVAIQALQRSMPDLKVLILSTKTCVRNAWESEAKRFTSFSVHVLLGSSSSRARVLASLPSGIVVTNHDCVRLMCDQFVQWAPDLVVFDECFEFKKLSTGRFKALKRIVSNGARMWGLCGTPYSQASPLAIYPVARLINPDAVPKTLQQWKWMTMYQVSRFIWKPRKDCLDHIKRALQPCIRHERKDCVDLPPVTTHTYEVGMTATQAKLYKDLRLSSIAKLEEGTVTAVNEGVMRNKLLQCCGGVVYDENHATIDVIGDGSDRAQAVLDIITECQHGVLVFANYRTHIVKLCDILCAQGISYGSIDGGTSEAERVRLIKSFQDEELDVIIAHPRTMGHGVTLTKADTVVWWTPISDNELYEQANARINRIGQQNPMRVIHLVSTEFEKKVIKALEEKRALHGQLLKMLMEE